MTYAQRIRPIVWPETVWEDLTNEQWAYLWEHGPTNVPLHLMPTIFWRRRTHNDSVRALAQEFHVARRTIQRVIATYARATGRYQPEQWRDECSEIRVERRTAWLKSRDAKPDALPASAGARGLTLAHR